MKKSLLLTGITSALLLTGCVDENTDVKIHSDGSVDVAQTYLLSKDLLSTAESQDANFKTSMLEELTPNFKQAGAVAKAYEKDDQEGIKITQSFDSLDDLFQSNFFAASENSQTKWKVQTKENFFATTNTIKGEVDYDELLSDALDVSEEQLGNLTNLSESLELSYTFTTPTKSYSNNADQSDYKTYTWSVEPHEKKSIDLKYHVLNMPHILMTAGIVAIGLIGLRFFLKKRRKKKTK